MNFALYFSQMVQNIVTAKMRSFLAILGILVGTASVVALVSGGDLAAQNALIQFTKLGTDLLALNIQSGSQGGNGAGDQITVKDVQQVRDSLDVVTDVGPYVSLYEPIIFHGKTINGTILGADQELQDVVHIGVANGRFVSSLDGSSYYCVLGFNVAKQLRLSGGQGSLIGQQIFVGKNVFTIVGTLKEWDQNPFMYGNVNSSIIIPIETAMLISKYARINDVIFRIKKGLSIPLIQNQITKEINKVIPGKKLFYRSSLEIIKSMDEQHRTFTWMLGFIGSISLIVGGIGVMNIMLVSVSERRREIGIRRAIGARSRDIQYMFLMESVGLTLIGGLIGVVVGVFASFLISDFAHWQFFFMPLPPLIGFMISMLTGIFFGYYPAFKASKLNPIEALRAE